MAAALRARIESLAALLGCPVEPVRRYLDEARARLVRYARVACRDTFDTLRLLTYQHGEVEDESVREAARAAETSWGPEGRDRFASMARGIGSAGFYSGLQVDREAGTALRLLADARATLPECVEALGLLEYPERDLAWFDPLGDRWHSTVGVKVPAQGDPEYRLVLHRRIDGASDATAEGRAISQVMANLLVPDPHVFYIEDNFSMFVPEGHTRDVLLTFRIGEEGLSPAVEIELLRLPANFVVDVLVDFGRDREVGDRIREVEEALGLKPDADGFSWVDGLVLSHEGPAAPGAWIAWVPDFAGDERS